MEEILASIRKIISEDQPPDGPKPPTRPQVVKAQPTPEPAPARPAAPVVPRPELDVLDLTDEIEDEEPAPVIPTAAVIPPAPAIPVVRPLPPTPARPAAPVIENDVIFQNIEPAKGRERAKDDDLISDTTRHAMGKAFSSLNGQAPNTSPKAAGIEAIFADAVQQAFRPVLQEWIADHSNEVMNQLRPLIRAWMDEHLPPLIEAAVIKEITRAAQRPKP
jgi:cell pole-organizing protein PopZ